MSCSEKVGLFIAAGIWIGALAGFASLAMKAALI